MDFSSTSSHFSFLLFSSVFLSSFFFFFFFFFFFLFFFSLFFFFSFFLLFHCSVPTGHAHTNNQQLTCPHHTPHPQLHRDITTEPMEDNQHVELAGAGRAMG